MNKFYAPMAYAVAALDNNTGAVRHAMYERARAMLVDHLLNCDPPLTDAEIQRQRLALEEAIRHVEDEAIWGHQEVLRPNSDFAECADDEPPPQQEIITPTEKAAPQAPRARPLSLAPPQPSAAQTERTNVFAQDEAPDVLSADQDNGDPSERSAAPADAVAGSQVHPRLQAMIQAGRYQGIELDPNQFRQTPGETTPSAAALSLWAQDAGMWSRAIRIRWRHLLRLNDSGPVVLLFSDGTAGSADRRQRRADGRLPQGPLCAGRYGAVPVDELRLSQVWAGEAVLLRVGAVPIGDGCTIQPALACRLVLQENRALRDIAIASLTLSFLTDVPAAIGHDDGQQGAAVSQRLDAGAAVRDHGGRCHL